MQERKSQKTLKTTTLRVFFTNFATPDLSFASALRDSTQQQHRLQTREVAVVVPGTVELRVPVPLHPHEQHAGQSVWAPNVDSCMLRIVTVV
jgi:hypothetical protein